MRNALKLHLKSILYLCLTGEFNDLLDKQTYEGDTEGKEETTISIVDIQPLPVSVSSSSNAVLLEIESLTLQTPQYTMTLIEELTLMISKGQNLLVCAEVRRV